MIRSPRARENQDNQYIKTEQNISFYTRQKIEKNHELQLQHTEK